MTIPTPWQEALVRGVVDDSGVADQMKERGLVQRYDATRYGYNGRTYTRCTLVLTDNGEALARRYRNAGVW